MNLVFINGDAAKKQWVNDAIAGSSFPFPDLDVTVNVNFTTLTHCTLAHTYMCTSQEAPGTYLIQIEPWANDPTSINNAGLPDPYTDLHEFFMDAFLHEIGHVVQDEAFHGDQSLITQACAFFTHVPDGRRGVFNDYFGTGEVDATWPEKIVEAISEWFRLAFRHAPQVYWNRTNWNLSQTDFESLFAMLMPNASFIYGDPIDCKTEISRIESGSITMGIKTIEFGLAVELSPDDPTQPFIAQDVIASISGSFSGIQMLYSPDIYVPIGGFFSYFSSFDGIVSGQDVKAFLVSIGLDEVSLHNPSQPAYLTAPRTLGLDSYEDNLDPEWHSAFQGIRGVLVSHWLPDPHDWGVVEVMLIFEYLAGEVSNRFDPGTTGLEIAYTFDGGELTANGDFSNVPGQLGTPPWFAPPALGVVSGDGPFFDGSPHTLESGYLAGFLEFGTHNFGNSSNSFNFEQIAATVQEGIYQPPALSVPTAPQPDDFSFTIGTHHSPPLDGDHWVDAVGNWRIIPWVFGNGSEQYPAGPQRARQDTLFVMGPPTEGADFFSEFTLRVRFFPVLKRSGGTPPPYPTRNPGVANAGPIAGGSLRANQAEKLAARQLHIVRRIAGGTITKT